ncbi:hypothetical protein LCGC14_1192490 [marine sediment metagenome]|uniref:Uncharacterized protein n=1 Tax=marine sediment metagenome TaxID=412755 RepID=A0A0F9LNT8_9ZZZZ
MILGFIISIVVFAIGFYLYIEFKSYTVPRFQIIKHTEPGYNYIIWDSK